MSNTFQPQTRYRAAASLGVVKAAIATASKIQSKLEEQGFTGVRVWTDAGDLPADWDGPRDGNRFIEATWGGASPLTLDPPGEVSAVWLAPPTAVAPKPVTPPPVPRPPPTPVGPAITPTQPVPRPLGNVVLTPYPMPAGSVALERAPAAAGTSSAWLWVLGAAVVGSAVILAKRKKKSRRRPSR